MMNKYIKTDEYSYCLGMSLTVEALKHKANYIKGLFYHLKQIKTNN